MLLLLLGVQRHDDTDAKLMCSGRTLDSYGRSIQVNGRSMREPLADMDINLPALSRHEGVADPQESKKENKTNT